MGLRSGGPPPQRALLLTCCLLSVVHAAKINKERCASQGFGETLTCGTCDKMRDALTGAEGMEDGSKAKAVETLVKECQGCCKNGLVSYIQGKFEVCD